MTPALRAALWMTGAVASFTAMAIAGREVSLDLDTFEIMTWRSLIGIVVIAAIGTARGLWGQVRTDRLPLHVARNLTHFAGQNLWFYAIATIPLAQVFALEFTAPIWAILFAALLLGERITRVGALAAAMGFAGILIVARPDPGQISPGMAAAAGSAVCFALTAIATRRLTRTQGIFCIMVWLTVLQAGFGLVCAGWDGDIALPTATTAPWLVLIGCAGLLAHFCLTTALSIAPASVVMPLDFARLPVIAVVGMLLYAEPLDPAVFAGGALIFVGNWLNLSRGMARTAPALPTSAPM